MYETMKGKVPKSAAVKKETRHHASKGREGLRVVFPIATILILILATGSVRANPDVRCICPTCNPYGQHCTSGCTFDYYTIYVYFQLPGGGTAAVQINGTDYSDGNIVAICSTIAYTITAFIQSPYDNYAFDYWNVTGGSVASQTSATTTLTPSSTNQANLAIDLIIGPTSGDVENWGGYVGSGSQISEAWGTFDIPTGTYTQPGLCSDTYTMAIWVGIGGLDNNQTLWQAGVQIQLPGNSNCFGGITMSEWYEAYPNLPVYRGGTPCDGNNYPYGVDLGINSTGAWVNYGSCGITKISGVKFVPDQTTAEWVVEAWGPLPSFPNFNFFK